uniref:Uncharacterized protein n=2 Tax=Oryza TaxID=4527 RepID=A0A0D3END5_9ORYZ
MAVGSREAGGTLDQSPSCAAAAEEGKLSARELCEKIRKKVIPAQSDGELSVLRRRRRRLRLAPSPRHATRERRRRD